MRNKLSGSIWGVFFVIIGIGYAGNVLFNWDFNLFFNGFWTLFIIIPCFIGMIKKGFGTGSTIGFIIGVLMLMSYYVDIDYNIWRLIIPVFLILIGVRILFQNAFRRRPNINYQYDSYESSQEASYKQDSQKQNFSGAVSGEYNAIFSGKRAHITDIFAGAGVNAVFGSVVLDLRDAKLPGDVEINAQAIFGGIDIFIPAGVKVKVNNVPVFGGVSNKANNNPDPAAPTIFLNSTCMFGGIDIK